MQQIRNKSAPIRNKDCDKMTNVGQRIYFSEWLQAEMNKRGWSQSDLARYADLNRAVINKLLNGKSHPQPPTLEAISRALKLPIEITYRAAGLLPSNPENDDAIDEAIHVLKSIQSAQRRATAIALLKALINEEENEKRGDGKGKR
jgi:transcriptional regulator with XRE-family HTH domain